MVVVFLFCLSSKNPSLTRGLLNDSRFHGMGSVTLPPFFVKGCFFFRALPAGTSAGVSGFRYMLGMMLSPFGKGGYRGIS
jgi:hypothetical protein